MSDFIESINILKIFLIKKGHNKKLNKIQTQGTQFCHGTIYFWKMLKF